MSSCPVLEAGEEMECSLARNLAGKRGGRSLVEALLDLRSMRQGHSAADLPPRLMQRLPLYLVALHELSRDGVQRVAAAELGLRIGISAASVRKDLSAVGHWGRRGAGYSVDVLSENLRRAAGLAEPRHAAWLGCERLSRYPGVIEDFRSVGCIISAVFCDDGRHVGQEVGGLIVKPVRELPQSARSLGLTVAVIAPESDLAQEVAEIAASAGISSILNLTDRIVLPAQGATIEDVSPLRGLVSLLLRTPTADKSEVFAREAGRRDS
ncbi:MAG: redox-sensing transcriptional repressor Rex [Armatimonadota bacterium]|nr:MAG: redox-sensing transcriptional repressor Rex [Armatimonadota bacterium]